MLVLCLEFPPSHLSIESLLLKDQLKYHFFHEYSSLKIPLSLLSILIHFFKNTFMT